MKMKMKLYLCYSNLTLYIWMKMVKKAAAAATAVITSKKKRENKDTHKKRKITQYLK